MLPGVVKFLASDELRAELLANISSDEGRYDPEMTGVSNIAFSELFRRAETYMTWPVSTDFLIIDTTGLNPDFREKIRTLCNKMHYNLVPVVFNYKQYKDFFTYAKNKSIVSKHVEKFKKETISAITKEHKKILYIRNRNFENVQVLVPSWDSYASHFVDPAEHWLIVADVRGDYPALLSLLSEFRESKPILLGDIFGEFEEHNKALKQLIDRGEARHVTDWVTARWRWIATSKFVNKEYLHTDIASTDNLSEENLAEGVYNDPFRVFGGTAVEKLQWQKNLGCIAASHSLVGIKFNYDNKPYSRSVPRTCSQISTSIVKADEHNDKDLPILSKELEHRYHKIIKNRAPYLSGTMPPAPSDKATNEFESISSALKYYKQHNVSAVCLQPKYMGSRCTVILKQGESYAISRSGFLISIDGIDELLLDLEDIYLNEKRTFAIIDGELLPWNALGKTLIDNSFETIAHCLQTEVALLTQNMHPSLQEAVNLEELRKGVATYREQLDIFNKSAPLDFKPFALLKSIDDGQEKVYHDQATSINFKSVSPDDYCVVSLENIEEAIDTAEKYFKQKTEDEKMEGVVVKVEFSSELGSKIPPAMKVRNNLYLTLIYGPTYNDPIRQAALIEKKKIWKKVKLAKLEHNLSNRLLAIPIAELGNREYCRLVHQFLLVNEKESQIDPRL